MNPIDAAKVVFADCLSLKDESDHQKRFMTIKEKYPEFVMRYLLVVKYMAVYFLYNEKFFIKLVDTLNKSRPPHLKSIEFQSIYVKDILNNLRENGDIKLSRVEIKKLANEEYSRIESEFNGIKRLEKKVKQEMKSKDIDDEERLRKEFTEFCLNNGN